MMANTSKKGGKLLVMSPDGPRADVSLLDSFIQGNVQNHMFGRDIPPWLPGSEDEEKAKSVGRTLTASVGTHQDRENNGGGTEAAFKGQDGRRRRGIHIPSPGDIEGIDIYILCRECHKCTRPCSLDWLMSGDLVKAFQGLNPVTSCHVHLHVH